MANEIPAHIRFNDEIRGLREASGGVPVFSYRTGLLTGARPIFASLTAPAPQPDDS